MPLTVCIADFLGINVSTFRFFERKIKEEIYIFFYANFRRSKRKGTERLLLKDIPTKCLKFKISYLQTETVSRIFRYAVE